MVPHILTLSLLLHLMAAITSQFMPPSFPFYPPQQQQQQQQQQQMQNMPMMQMQSGQPGIQMAHGAQMIPMANMPPMMPHMPRLPGMPPPMPPPMHLPMPLSMNGGRLPMVVMPHYSKKADKPSRRKSRKPKRKRIKIESSSSDESCSESAEFRSRNNLRTSKKRREVLTPVVSYVTKDGYVVYQKKIKKDKAKDWLELTKGGASKEFKDKVKIKKS